MKLFTGQKLLILIIVLILGVVLYSYSYSKGFVIDRMEGGTDTDKQTGGNAPTSQSNELNKVQENVIAPNTGSIYNLKTVANPSDLLPQDKNSQWATLNPALNPNNVIIPDLLEAGYHIGLDTIGQSLRNANYQERSDPIIPKSNAPSIWNQSTIEPNLGQVSFELGGGCRN